MFLSWICHRIQQDSTGFNRIQQDSTGFNRIQQDSTGFNRIQQDSTHCDRSVLHFPGAGNAQTDLDCSDMFGLLLC